MQDPQVTLASLVPEKPPVRLREIAVVVAGVVLCDAALYRAQGFSGPALFFALVPVLLLLGASRRCCNAGTFVFGAMLLVSAAKTAWCGTYLLLCVGAWLTAAFAVTLAGLPPHVPEICSAILQMLSAGYAGLVEYEAALRCRRFVASPAKPPRRTKYALLLPLGIAAAFGTLFVLANPDIAKTVGAWLRGAWDATSRRIAEFSPQASEVVVWVVALWIATALLRPRIAAEFLRPAAGKKSDAAPTEAILYVAVRNTLLVVIVLFAGYLVFEFKTLWFRVFPKGFYYSGYAHEGAAWLIVALLLTTLVLSLFFRGRLLNDPRLPTLRRLAWLWSFENFLLVAAVYNRLGIYVGFNGMTRMRVVAFLGITAVAFGFGWVVWKIARRQDFGWLVRRHLWTLGAAVYLFAVLPVDSLVMRYNVRRILAGDPAPCVQISVHPIDAGGVARLTPLLECDDVLIRDGVTALLAEARASLHGSASRASHWTDFQEAERALRKKLDARESALAKYAASPTERQAALEKFHAYAYQWY